MVNILTELLITQSECSLLCWMVDPEESDIVAYIVLLSSEIIEENYMIHLKLYGHLLKIFFNDI